MNKTYYGFKALETEVSGKKSLRVNAQELIACCHTLDWFELSLPKMGYNEKDILPLQDVTGEFRTDELVFFSFIFKRVEYSNKYDKITHLEGKNFNVCEENGEYEFKFTYNRDAFNNAKSGHLSILVAPLSYSLRLKNLEGQ